MKPQQNTAFGRSAIIVGEGGGGGGGVKPVLLVPNFHPHLSPRITQLSWLLGSHGGLLGHQCAVMANN